jgi:hypothetical protein
VEDQVERWILCRRRSEEVHIRQLLRQINADALCAKATQLRDGVPCRAMIPAEDDSLAGLQFGGFNLHVDVKFVDGVEWIARFRLLKINRPCDEKLNFDRLSEVATYRLLQPTPLPTPLVHYFADDKENAVGVGYTLMEKLPGHPMNWYTATAKQKQHVFRQLRDMYLELEKLPQTSIGRPFMDSKGVRGGVCFFDYDENGKCIPNGPFDSSTEWYERTLSHRRDLIIGGEIATGAMEDALAVNQFLTRSIPKVVGACYNSGPFFLKHIDTRDCNFLIDEEYTITGIIDWELAHFAPKDSAFQAPLFMVDVSTLFGGMGVISADEVLFAEEFDKVGRTDLGKLVREGFKSRCFEMALYADPHSREDFENLFAGAWKVVNSANGFSWDTWRLGVGRDEFLVQGQQKRKSEMGKDDW